MDQWSLRFRSKVSFKRKLVEFRKHCTKDEKKKDSVAHFDIFREHNQEADHLANLEAKGQRKVMMERVKEYRRMESTAWLLGMEAKKTTASAFKCVHGLG